MTTNEALQFKNELLQYQVSVLKLEIERVELLRELEMNKLKTLFKIVQTLSNE